MLTDKGSVEHAVVATINFSTIVPTKHKNNVKISLAITHTRRAELNGDGAELGNELVQQVLR